MKENYSVFWGSLLKSYQTCLHVAPEALSPSFVAAAWSSTAVMCCNHPLQEEVANWCCSCCLESIWPSRAVVNFPHPWVAFLKHILSFNDISKSGGFLEQNPTHVGDMGLWLGQKIPQLGHSFCLMLVEMDENWNGSHKIWDETGHFWWHLVCCGYQLGIFWFQWTETSLMLLKKHNSLCYVNEDIREDSFRYGWILGFY